MLLDDATEKKPRGSYSLAFHARRRFGQAVQLDSLTAEQIAQLESDRHTWVEELARKGLRTRQLNKAKRLREQAAAIEAQVLAGVTA